MPDSKAPSAYVTAPATRAAIVRAVIATGSVNPVVKFQVGAFVSGPIQVLHCDDARAVAQRYQDAAQLADATGGGWGEVTDGERRQWGAGR